MGQEKNPLYGIIWDLDGVLVDTGRYHFESWKKILSRRGIEFTEEQFRNLFGRNNRSVLEDVLGHQPTDQEVNEIGGEKEEIFLKDIRGRAELLPGVWHLLEAFELRGYSQAIASSAPPSNINQLVDELKIRKYFQCILTGKSYPSKPSPELFLAAAHELNIEPVHCLVIEDALAGIEGAHKASMHCLAVATTHPLEDLHQAEMSVYRLSDVNLDEVFKLVEGDRGIHDG